MPAERDEIEDLYIGADMTAEYLGARDEVAGEYLNGGACTYVLKNPAGATIASGSMPYQTDSDGDYRAAIDGPTVTAGLTHNSIYTVEITFVHGEFDDKRYLKFRARRRGSR